MPIELSVLALLAAVAVLLAVSAFFSSTEIALFSLTPDRLDALAAADDRGPQLKCLREDPTGCSSRFPSGTTSSTSPSPRF